MEKKFKVGDLVVLKSGSETMTIIDDKTGFALDAPGGKVYCGIYVCSWFDSDKRMQKAHLPQDSIKLSE